MSASLAASLSSLSETDRNEILAGLSDQEILALEWDWRFVARANQVAPEGLWSIWLVQAGRGFGKTRVGAEWIREQKDIDDVGRFALVGPTAGDARDVMVEGPAGILPISPPWDRPRYEPSKRRVTWKNGVIAMCFSADEPDRLRGPQHSKAWGDEIAAWKYAQEAWDNLMFGLRLGVPQVLATTTPRPIALIRALHKDPACIVTRGSTFENRANLAPSFFTDIVGKYEGTRIGRQELGGELLDDVPGALWQRRAIDADRVAVAPELIRIVVAIDPAVTSNDDSNETGIIAAGLGVDGHGYALRDLSGRLPATVWPTRAVAAYHDLKADRIVAEVNNGGDLVEQTIRVVDKQVSYKAVHASRGKRTRAEPIAALYEQHRIHHVGSLPGLEDQMCLGAGTRIATRRGAVPIELVSVGDEVWTREGWRFVLWSGQTGVRQTMAVRTEDGRELRATESHPLYVEGAGFVSCSEVHPGAILLACQRPSNLRSSSLAESGISAMRETATSRRAALVAAGHSTGTYGAPPTARSPRNGTSIIETAIAGTTHWQTSRQSRHPLTNSSTRQQASPPARVPSGAPTQLRSGRLASLGSFGVPSAETAYRSAAPRLVSVACTVASVTAPRRTAEPVYNLTVAGQPEFFANGLLVHNCAYVPDEYDGSPDRVDALVWAFTELMLNRRAPVQLNPADYRKAGIHA